MLRHAAPRAAASSASVSCAGNARRQRQLAQVRAHRRRSGVLAEVRASSGPPAPARPPSAPRGSPPRTAPSSARPSHSPKAPPHAPSPPAPPPRSAAARSSSAGHGFPALNIQPQQLLRAAPRCASSRSSAASSSPRPAVSTFAASSRRRQLRLLAVRRPRSPPATSGIPAPPDSSPHWPRRPARSYRCACRSTGTGASGEMRSTSPMNVAVQHQVADHQHLQLPQTRLPADSGRNAVPAA